MELAPPGAFEWALNHVTPLQRRLLDALTSDPLPLSTVALRAGLRCYIGGRHRASRGPDTTSARNGLLYLELKGLAVREGALWSRPVPADRRQPRFATPRQMFRDFVEVALP